MAVRYAVRVGICFTRPPALNRVTGAAPQTPRQGGAAPFGKPPLGDLAYPSIGGCGGRRRRDLKRDRFDSTTVPYARAGDLSSMMPPPTTSSSA